jgi:hypothetical protein
MGGCCFGRATTGASAVWGELQQQIFLTRSREEREGKRFLWLVPLFEEDSSATEFRPLRVLRGFA